MSTLGPEITGALQREADNLASGDSGEVRDPNLNGFTDHYGEYVGGGWGLFKNGKYIYTNENREGKLPPYSPPDNPANQPDGNPTGEPVKEAVKRFIGPPTFAMSWMGQQFRQYGSTMSEGGKGLWDLGNYSFTNESRAGWGLNEFNTLNSNRVFFGANDFRIGNKLKIYGTVMGTAGDIMCAAIFVDDIITMGKRGNAKGVMVKSAIYIGDSIGTIIGAAWGVNVLGPALAGQFLPGIGASASSVLFANSTGALLGSVAGGVIGGGVLGLGTVAVIEAKRLYIPIMQAQLGYNQQIYENSKKGPWDTFRKVWQDAAVMTQTIPPRYAGARF